MKILGIESSCDDTSAALLECSKSGCFVLRESTASQIAIHKKYGGVVPEIAGRMHAEKIIPLIENVLDGKKPDAIAVASGPGLITGLIVGVEAARTLSATWKIPVIQVNHMAGHIHSVEIIKTLKHKNIKTNGEKCHCEERMEGATCLPAGRRGNLSKNMSDGNNIIYPALALIVSGGHTEIIKISAPNKYKMIGATRDDAAGECFDKAAKMLGLPYPGGPQISKLALKGKTDAIKFPRPMLDSDNFDFSFSGLKTSALYYYWDNPLVIARSGATKQSQRFLNYQGIASAIGARSRSSGLAMTVNDFCASFEQAIVDTLVGKMTRAIKKFKPKTVILCGGVSANKKLRETLATAVAKFSKTKFLVPENKYCMDNAAMVAQASFSILSSPRRRGSSASVNKYTAWKKLQADPNWELGR